MRSILERRYGDRSDGSFTVVFRVRGSSADPALRARLQAAVDRAARILPTGRPTPLVPAGGDVLYADIASTLTLAEAKRYADDVYAAVGQPPRTTAYVTGPASIQHDLDPIFSGDLQRGEAIALPIALAVLVAVLGLSYAVTIPFLFAGFTIFGTLGLVWIAAHFITTPTYVTNLVFLIGLGIAIDYSLLVVYRFREELAGGRTKEEALLRTMETAGRAVVFSGATVAIGLALLLAMPLPFMRAMGVGGFLIPLVSIAAALTAQPALLSLYGRRGTARAPVAGWARSLGVPLPRLPGALESERSFWARLSVAIMRRPLAFVAVAGALMLAAASPVFALELTPGSVEGIPRHPQSVQGFDLLRETIGPGAISPTQVLVDAGREGAVLAPRTQAAIASLVRKLEADPEVAAVYYARGGRFVEPGRRYALILVAGRHEYGDQPAQAFVRRLRDDLLPSVRWPSGVKALAGGGPAQGVDFLDETYSAFPWLVLAVLGLTYLLLLRAFRSLFLPLKAVLLNLLSVAAAYGLLVTVFKWGVGNDVLGLYRFDQVEGWIPVFLFAMLFGLSMDYEVFLVSRMREAWDEVGDNGRAVAIGLERTGRIVTAAAVIMVAAFSGFLAGRIVGLQEFGFGLAAAVLFDATVIRAVLVPALMAVMGRYNWWLPERAARLARVKPSPLEPPAFRATGRENVLVAGEATVSRE
ncbi:MAG TPA: MMPL family transporter [Gaiellaceae bacterium]|nr:MMPL family transporter [Gaiellaceae bacterium]